MSMKQDRFTNITAKLIYLPSPNIRTEGIW